MPDLMVKTAVYEVSLANQKFKNALNVRAHQNQYKERVVEKPLSPKPIEDVNEETSEKDE
ncbi:hypothetical protein U1Q18_038084, partial [Sarracenia purpurea var. burkii]